MVQYHQTSLKQFGHHKRKLDICYNSQVDFNTYGHMERKQSQIILSHMDAEGESGISSCLQYFIDLLWGKIYTQSSDSLHIDSQLSTLIMRDEEVVRIFRKW